MFKRLTGLVITLALVALPALAPAQVRITITGGQEKALPIAIVPLQVREGLDQPDTDIASVIAADLQRTGVFEPLPRENFVSRPGSSDEVRYANWRALGADHLVVGSIAPAAGGDYTVVFELMNVYGGRRLIQGRYTVRANALRTAAHTIANDIFKELVGRSGAFNSNLVYVQRKGTGDDQTFRLVHADADGHRAQTILTSDHPILSPAWSPDRERIAYVSFEGGRSEIYIQEVRTGERRKVASFEGINSAPAFSPDGSRLAMTLSRAGNPDIYILDLATGEITRVTDHYGIDTEPVWTPDGEHIVFTSDRAGGPQIYRMPVSGGDARRMTFEGSYNASPDLSTDGRLLTMVHRGRDGFHIAVKDLEKDLMRVLTDGRLDESPSISPNGAMIVYTRVDGSLSELATVSVHGRANQSLHQFEGEVLEPAWSPL